MRLLHVVAVLLKPDLFSLFYHQSLAVTTVVEKSAAKFDWCGDLKPGAVVFLDHSALAFIYLLVPLGWHTIAIVPVFPTMISARSDACKRFMHEMSGNGHEFDRGIQTVGSAIVQSTKKHSSLSQDFPPDSLPNVTPAPWFTVKQVSAD
jgi:hypothetical protein